VLTLGGLRFEILWPPARAADWRASGNPNDNALVARLEAGRFSMLLSADAESGVTAPLPLEPVDVLKVAHHGSADPGLPALLERLHPRVAAIEVGKANTYGHPAPSTLAALERAVPTILRTDRDGTTRLHAANGRMWVEG
jgi:competence protein ComEC